MTLRHVLLISGWTKPDFLWQKLENDLWESGFRPHVLHYGRRGFGCIEKYAEIAADWAIKHGPFHRSHIIGHSMGGLVARAAIQLYNVRFERYISIGTPHQGTYTAYAAPWSRSAKQMRPGSRFLANLDALPWPDIPALGINGSWEEVVVPQSSALISFGENITVPNATHGSLLLDGRVSSAIIDWLS